MRRFDRKYLSLGITICLSLCGAILFFYLLFFGEKYIALKASVIKVLLPIIDGIVIAYVLSPIQDALEQRILEPMIKKLNKKGKDRSKLVHGLGTFLTLFLFLLVVVVILLLIIPQVIESLSIIISRVPLFLEKLETTTYSLINEIPEVAALADTYWPQVEDLLLKQVLPGTSSLLANVSSGLVGGVVSFISATFNFILGIIISIYLLGQKGRFCAQAKKLCYAFMKEERANNLINNTRFANRIFGGFISGKIIDSILIGIICFIGMSILRIPYALLISVVVGVTNVIPYFGPFLGAIPSAIIILMISPVKCLIFLIWIVVLQQFDGNVLGPKILGDSTGLSGFWVIFSIIVFGGLWGVFGMFIGVPLFALVYAAIKTAVNTRLEKKKLPSDTEFYVKSDYHSNSQDDADEHSGKKFKYGKQAFDHVTEESENKPNDEE